MHTERYIAPLVSLGGDPGGHQLLLLLTDPPQPADHADDRGGQCSNQRPVHDHLR